MLIVLIINIAFSVAFMIFKYILSLNLQIGDILESVILGVVWLVAIGLVEFKGLKKNWAELISKE